MIRREGLQSHKSVFNDHKNSIRIQIFNVFAGNDERLYAFFVQIFDIFVPVVAPAVKREKQRVFSVNKQPAVEKNIFDNNRI